MTSALAEGSEPVGPVANLGILRSIIPENGVANLRADKKPPEPWWDSGGSGEISENIGQRLTPPLLLIGPLPIVKTECSI
jgi:hypothetical protein